MHGKRRDEKRSYRGAAANGGESLLAARSVHADAATARSPRTDAADAQQAGSRRCWPQHHGNSSSRLFFSRARIGSRIDLCSFLFFLFFTTASRCTPPVTLQPRSRCAAGGLAAVAFLFSLFVSLLDLGFDRIFAYFLPLFLSAFTTAHIAHRW